MENVDELVKINSDGKIKTRQAKIDTRNLKTENESQLRAPNLRKGFEIVTLKTDKGEIPVGTYFIKEATDDEETEGPKQLLRYGELKKIGARVPNTFRKYTEDGKGYYVMTDLTCGGKSWVWGITDEKVPENAKSDWIKWDELTTDTLNNAVKATEAMVRIDGDAHIVSVSSDCSHDYLADLDKGTWTKDEMAKFTLYHDGTFTVRANNLIESIKILIRFAHATQQENQIPKICQQFWDETRKHYTKENPSGLADELINKSCFDMGINAQDARGLKIILTQN